MEWKMRMLCVSFGTCLSLIIGFTLFAFLDIAIITHGHIVIQMNAETICFMGPYSLLSVDVKFEH